MIDELYVDVPCLPLLGGAGVSAFFFLNVCRGVLIQAANVRKAGCKEAGLLACSGTAGLPV